MHTLEGREHVEEEGEKEQETIDLANITLYESFCVAKMCGLL